MMKCKILVLLAVYNGSKWIDEQLKSILSQENVQLDVLASVDLSTDGSFEHISENYPNVKMLPYGERYGSAGKNFYRLLQDADFSGYDYISFADQDDIWLSDKLSHSVKMIIDKNVDVYSGNVTAFWADGRQCLIDKSQSQVEFDYFFEAAGPGCTYVFTKKLALHFQKFLREVPTSQDIVLHDWLIYAFARSNHYRWFIDKESKMLYRQHENNQVGANESFTAACKRVKLVKSGWYRKEVAKLITLFSCEHHQLLHTFVRRRLFPSISIIKNAKDFRRRPRDRCAFIVFHLFRFI